jgi:hypothetical protein
MKDEPNHYSDVESCVEETLRKVGRRIALGYTSRTRQSEPVSK